MWLIERIISFCLFPVFWFWNALAKEWENRNFGKIVLLFILSLSGLVLFTGSIVWIAIYIFTYHIEVVFIIGFIIWLYAYVRLKIKQGNMKQETEKQEQAQSEKELRERAEKGYPIVRNLMYQTLKEEADSIGCKVPRIVEEIEVRDRHYILEEDICFYQIKLAKADIRMRYAKEELIEFAEILENAIARKIQAKEIHSFPTEIYYDDKGNPFNAVSVDTIEDMDTNLLIQIVIYSPSYADFVRQKRLNQEAEKKGTFIPDARWEEKNK